MEFQRFASILLAQANELLALTGHLDAGERVEQATRDQIAAMHEHLCELQASFPPTLQPSPDDVPIPPSHLPAQVTSLIYLADGCEVRADVQRADERRIALGEGTAVINGRTIPVMRLAAPFDGLGYGEVVYGRLRDGTSFGAVWRPEEYKSGVASFSQSDSADATICIRDKQTGIWREMTDDEYEKERCAWDADEKDMARIKREWDRYRREGLGNAG